MKLLFSIVYDGGSGYIPVRMELYEKVREEFFCQEDLTQDEEFYVDRDWAYSLLGEGEEE